MSRWLTAKGSELRRAHRSGRTTGGARLCRAALGLLPTVGRTGEAFRADTLVFPEPQILRTLLERLGVGTGLKSSQGLRIGHEVDGPVFFHGSSRSRHGSYRRYYAALVTESIVFQRLQTLTPGLD